ncbi:uncharacterized protein G2W53_023738 [Senna tora]|uniref:Uncharacterized protein n=1 Tax=Senna tora TaxID=362788 RepID=A0A834WES4_9FABA|nr:uncharacterized protein G2W53_023738 [Senna tora]
MRYGVVVATQYADDVAELEASSLLKVKNMETKVWLPSQGCHVHDSR